MFSSFRSSDINNKQQKNKYNLFRKVANYNPKYHCPTMKWLEFMQGLYSSAFYLKDVVVQDTFLVAIQHTYKSASAGCTAHAKQDIAARVFIVLH